MHCSGEAPTGSLTETHVSQLASLVDDPTQTPSTHPPPSPPPPPPPPPPPATTTPLSLGSVEEVCGGGHLSGRCFYKIRDGKHFYIGLDCGKHFHEVDWDDN